MEFSGNRMTLNPGVKMLKVFGVRFWVIVDRSNMDYVGGLLFELNEEIEG